MNDQNKKLVLSNRSRMIGGVCGGFAEYFSLDPTLARVGYVLISAFMLGLPGILAYIIMWAIMPRVQD